MLFRSGILTKVIPSGLYQRVLEDGRYVIDSSSFAYVAKPDYPIWRILTAPFEVLFSQDAPIVIVIILFIVVIGGVFALLEKSGVLNSLLNKIILKYGDKKYLLLAFISGIFMIFGSSIGLFEELIVFVPMSIALSIALGWDSLLGLGMTIRSEERRVGKEC